MDQSCGAFLLSSIKPEYMLRKATRQKAKIRLGLSAVAGGGKTYSAILIALGLTGDLSKVAIIDTENGSADLYSDLEGGNYNVWPLEAPYTPERYIEAIKGCEAAGMEVTIIDSISHEWEGKGGCLEIADAITQASQSKNSYTAWSKVTPRHQAFIEAILHSPMHIITTVRRKQDYEMVKENGKVTVNKVGMREVTREGFEYELTVNLEMNVNHYASASKDRTKLFMGKPEFIPSVETGKLIAAWCDQGQAIDVSPGSEWHNKVEACSTVPELVALYNNNKLVIDTNPILQQLISNRRVAIKFKEQQDGLKQSPATNNEMINVSDTQSPITTNF